MFNIKTSILVFYLVRKTQIATSLQQTDPVRSRGCVITCRCKARYSGSLYGAYPIHFLFIAWNNGENPFLWIRKNRKILFKAWSEKKVGWQYLLKEGDKIQAVLIFIVCTQETGSYCEYYTGKYAPYGLRFSDLISPEIRKPHKSLHFSSCGE